jgi:predicted transposase/invertase (TIGR01784 family)
MFTIINVNNQYKNSVFSFLFSDPAILCELYEALEGVTLPPNVPITINTLEGVLFLDRINDISFEIGNKLVVLIEHQSTANPNMAVRLLMYIARLYEKMLASEDIYSGKKIALPRPEFIVLYNGTDPYPDTQVLRLSDSFENAAALGLPKDALPELDLVVKVYNINKGRNEAIVRRSETLNGYSVFVAKVRECEADKRKAVKRELTKEESQMAMVEAIKWCIAHDTLKSFLETHSSEVINMLLTEWDWDKYVEVQKREAREETREETRAEDVRNMLVFGMAPEQISQALKLPLETVRQYQSQ